LKQLHLLRSKRDNDSNTIAIIRVYVYVIVPRRACLWKWDFKIFRIIRYRIVPRSLRASKWFRSEVIVSETIEQAIVRNCSTVLYTKLTYRSTVSACSVRRMILSLRWFLSKGFTSYGWSDCFQSWSSNAIYLRHLQYAAKSLICPIDTKWARSILIASLIFMLNS